MKAEFDPAEALPLLFHYRIEGSVMCVLAVAHHRRKSSIRAKVEHPFLTLKRIGGFAKTRYRGLAKNANRALSMLAMVNLVKWGGLSRARCVRHERNAKAPRFHRHNRPQNR